jgi:hypothetical protein
MCRQAETAIMLMSITPAAAAINVVTDHSRS